jgi:hypothetical protein
VIGPKTPGDALSGLSDFRTGLSVPPSDTAANLTSVWGTAVWGVSVWGTDRPRNLYQDWRSISASGFALSAAYQITTGSIDIPDFELVRIDLTYEMGDIAP